MRIACILATFRQKSGGEIMFNHENLVVSYEYSFPGILIDIKFIEGHLCRGGEKEMCEKIE